ncbi:MAG: DEAD/DEAH box helicase, partial [Candidatus Sericytochromatia bacterium]
MFNSFESFSNDYMNPIQKDNNLEISNELKKKIYPFILRRLKKEVLDDLPPKIEQTIFVDMSKEQYKLYEQRRAFYYKSLKNQIAEEGINKSQFIILQALNELRQIASTPETKSDGSIISSKREILMDYINEVISLDHRVLIFTNYLGSLDYISEDLEKAEIEHLIMTGATHKRQELVDKFQNNDKYKVFLMTLKTGGVGLNLTKADYVFIYDPWWNKAAENQAIDRTHRIGQDKTVFSYKLITKNTIEEKILKLQELKTDLFNKIISSDDTSIKAITESDIDFMFGE